MSLSIVLSEAKTRGQLMNRIDAGVRDPPRQGVLALWHQGLLDNPYYSLAWQHPGRRRNLTQEVSPLMSLTSASTKPDGRNMHGSSAFTPSCARTCAARWSSYEAAGFNARRREAQKTKTKVAEQYPAELVRIRVGVSEFARHARPDVKLGRDVRAIREPRARARARCCAEGPFAVGQ